ncbi:MAG: xylulokinase, partial [Lentisphaeria bacterium]|nr:xylulokinase [Lentisphaeria bacterium]
VYGKIAHVLFPKDYLKWKLTGVLDIDVTDAPATGLFNTAKRTWEDDIFTKLDIDRSFVPAGASESTDIIGYVTAEAAEFLGIPKGIPVVGGGGDQLCGACGLGVVDTGIVSSTIGTSGCVFSYSPHCVIDRKPRALLSYCHSVPGSWCVFGCTLMSGGSLRWLRDTMMPGAGYDEMTALAEKAQPGSEGLVFLPYLNGERTPHPDPNARGVFFGLSARHGRGELIRSVMEGVAYSLCDTVGILREQSVPVSEIRAAGGGAVSPLWRQIQADIFRTTVVTTNVVESPATGAAMMAAVGAGSFSSLKEASDAVVRITSRTEPNDFNMRVYEDYYETYRALYDSLQPHFTAQARKVERWNDKSN